MTGFSPFPGLRPVPFACASRGHARGSGRGSGRGSQWLAAAFMLVLLLLAPLGLAAAEPLPAPSGPVLLTVSGALANSNAEGGEAAFDLAMLQHLPARTIETTTPWTEGPQTFTGIALGDLLAYLGATGIERIHAQASNNYEITFPARDVTDHGAILAYLQNGAPLARDKGPLWIVYDYDSDPQLLGDRFQSASIWNLVRLSLR